IYLGGGMGGWCGTRFITNLRPETIKTGPQMSLCPSHPDVHRSLVEYYAEMMDALPEADGIYLESADEDGACNCPVCSKALDEFGSKQFGQSQLAILEDLAKSVWERHPRARFVYTIGYGEHSKDVAYYQ